MDALHRTGPAGFGKAAVAAFCATLASASASQGWPSLSAQNWPSLYADEPTSLVVEADSVSRVPEFQGVVGAWFQYTHPERSARCIPPPRACYAKAQRIHYRINCANGALAQIQRITMDLNGDVSSQSDPDFNAPYLLPPAGALEGGLARFICSSLVPQ